MTERADNGGRSIAARLDHLFRVQTKPKGGEYSHREVEKEIRNRYGAQLSHSYIGQLRAGRQANPSINALRLLARFFGVPVEYFTRDDLASEVDQELQFAMSLRELQANQDVRALVVRARGISSKSLQSVAEIMERIREIEGLPPSEGSVEAH